MPRRRPPESGASPSPVSPGKHQAPGPLGPYRQLLAEGRLAPDPAQEEAARLLQGLYEALAQAPARPGLLARLLGRAQALPGAVKGIYFWGGVGRGKTLLMDLFHASLRVRLGAKASVRLHFHRFMREVHQQLSALQGQANPLEQVAASFARRARVICFDEFQVSDITDAMILAGLLDALFRRGLTLVATSNAPPDDLYKEGLQRRKFLPAIALLKAHTRVHRLDGGMDYRRQALAKSGLYHSPLDGRAEPWLAEVFRDLAAGEGQKALTLAIEGRPIRTRRCGEDVAWFDFLALCDGPRSQNDYMELARLYQTVLIGKVPCLTAERDDQARRFISLVDEFYDRGVNLILAAAAPPEALYQGERLRQPFQRTASRLREMQSEAYLGKEHKA